MNPNQGLSIFVTFFRVVLQVWEAREVLLRQHDRPLEPPRVMSDIRNRLAQIRSNFSQHSNIELSNGAAAINIDEYLMPMPMEFSGPDTGGQWFTGSGSRGFPDIPGQIIMDIDMNQFWTTINWNWIHAQGW
jgi:hypothetical protein